MYTALFLSLSMNIHGFNISSQQISLIHIHVQGLNPDLKARLSGPEFVIKRFHGRVLFRQGLHVTFDTSGRQGLNQLFLNGIVSIPLSPFFPLFTFDTAAP